MALVLDEFQEVVEIDPDLPKLMRSVFQEQPDVAHVYLGSKRHMMERLFNDENEPFWRSARQMELGVIAPALFRRHIERRFATGHRPVAADAVDAVLAVTGGHPYATQELCYALWEQTPAGRKATATASRRPWRPCCAPSMPTSASSGTGPPRSSAGCSWRWHASPAGRSRRSTATATIFPAPSSVQRALQSLVREELVAREGSTHRIAEPFLAEWILRDAV